MTLRIRVAALAVLACAAFSSARADGGYIGMVSAIDVNAVCGLDGPKIDKDKVRDVFWAARYDDGQPRTGGYKVVDSEKPAYCHAARIVGLKSWSSYYAKEAKGMDVSKKSTAEVAKLTKLYAELFADGNCRKTGMGEADAETTFDLRGVYLTPVLAYLRRPIEKSMLGMGKATSTRQEAVAVLAAVDDGAAGGCKKALTAERVQLLEDTASAISVADSKK